MAKQPGPPEQSRSMRFPAGGNLWRTQRYYPWSARRNRGMLAGLKVGYDEGTDERLSRAYAYNSFGDITALTEGADSYAFSYDGLVWAADQRLRL